MAYSSRHSSQIGDGDETMVSAVEMQPTGPGATGFQTVEMQPIGSQAMDEEEVNSRLPNPLALLTQQQVLAEVADFVTQKGLSKHMRLFQTAALVAQGPSPSEYALINELKLARPAEYEGVRLLEEEELDALRDEPLKRFKHPRELYWTIVLCSVGAIVQGWDQTGPNGANIFFPDALGIPISEGGNAWLVGLINSAPYLSAALLGCWLSDPLNFHLGRRGTIFVAGIFSLVPVILSGFVKTWEQLLICRLVLGIGMGAKATTVPIFAAENSPASIRGALVMSWQMYVAFGIFLGFSANILLWTTGDIKWRLQLASAFIPAVPLVLGIYLCPESPRWYMKKGRYQQAFASLRRLRNTDLQAARDLFYIHAQLKMELELKGDKGYFVRLMELVTLPRNRSATIASLTVMIAQQMCGINIIAFYSSTVFKYAGASDKTALWGSWGFGLVNFLFALPALYVIDTWGRRTLLLFTFPQMAWTLLAAGFCSLVKASLAHVILVTFFVFLFAAFYSTGEGPVPFTFSAEVFPLSHREMGMGLAVATNLFWAAVLSVTFPRMLAVMGSLGAFAFYAGLNVLAFIMIFLLMPETKQYTLEELDYIFAVSATRFARYQIAETIPYLARYCVHPRERRNRRTELYEISSANCC